MIDVSSYQDAGGLRGQGGTPREPIDWQKVYASGVERVYVKLGEGLPTFGGPDPFGVTNIREARAAGLQVGVYYFAHPKLDADTSAAYFLSLAKGHLLPGDIVPALDLEVEEGHSLNYLAAWKAAWFDHVDAAIGTEACFYSYTYMLGFMYPHLKPERPVWGAWPGQWPPPNKPVDRAWWLWQHGTVKVPGIVGPVDSNIPIGAVPVIPGTVTSPDTLVSAA